MKKVLGKDSPWRWAAVTAIISAAALAIYFFIPFAGLEENAKRILILFFWCFFMWICKPIPEWLSTTFAAFLMVSFCGVSGAAVLSGFSMGAWWLVFYAEIMGAVLSMTGLGSRLGYWVLAKFGKTYLRASYAMNITIGAMGSFVPSASARAAVLCPIIDGLENNLGHKRGEAGGESISLSTMFTNTTCTLMFLTACGASPTGMALMQNALGDSMSWGSFFVAGFIPSIVTILFIPWVINKMYPPKNYESSRKKIDVSYAEEALKAMGPLSKNEKWTLFCFALTLLMWITNSYTGINDSFTVFLTVPLMLLPCFSVGDSKKILSHVTMGPLVWIGLSIGIADVLNSVGAFSWLITNIFDAIPWIYNVGYTTFLAIWLAFIIFVHIIFAGMNAMTMIFVPMAMTMAETLGFSPFVLGSVTVMAIAIGANFLPFNSMPNIISFDLERYSVSQEFKAGCIINLFALVALLATAFLFWPLIGLS